MCNQIGPQNNEVMCIEKLALNSQGLRVKRNGTQVLRCSDRCRKGLNKSECLHMQVHLGEIK